MEKYLSVLCYPHNDNKLDTVINVLNGFIKDYSKKLNIDINIKAFPTAEFNPVVHNLLQQFLSFSEQQFNYVDIEQIIDLFEIIKHPSGKTLKMVLPSHSNVALLELFRTTKKIALSLSIEEVFQFISLGGLKLKPGQGPWGTCKYEYPFTVAVDTTGYKEVILHEFLHQLGVKDGYDETNHLTTCVCTCWMQYNATMGNSLCEKHLTELIDFIRSNKLYA